MTPGNFAIGGGFTTKGMRYFEGKVPKEFALSPGDVVVTMTDLSKAGDTLGYSAIIPNDGNQYLHNQRIGKVITHANAPLHKNFVYWLLRSPKYRAMVLGSATGSTVRHTAPSRILSLEFNLPSLAEQIGIADILGTLDSKIELNRRLAETLEAMARALFKSWFVDFDPVHARAAGRPTGLPKSLAELFPNRFGEDGWPEGWHEKPLAEFLSIIGGGTPKTSVPEYWNGGIPWFSVTDTPPVGTVFVLRAAFKTADTNFVGRPWNMREM